MFDPGAATRQKEHGACEKDKDCHGIHDMCDNIGSDSKLLSVAEKCMDNDLCKSLYTCTDLCMGDVLTCMADDKCKALLPQMDYSKKKPTRSSLDQKDWARGYGYMKYAKISVIGNNDKTTYS